MAFNRLSKPERDIRHISETASIKLFNSVVPDHWLIREVTERDYGVDFYLEIVDEDNRLTGKLISIQMKSRQRVAWTKQQTHAVSDIKISTTNYWNEFAIPVFLILADLEEKELYYLSVRSFAREHYMEYIKQAGFTYHFKKQQRLRTKAELEGFLEAYSLETSRKRFESTLFTFLSSLTPYADFITEHNNLDYHLGLEEEDAIFIEAILSNYHFLSEYLNLENNLPSITELKVRSKKMFGDEHYEIYEAQLSQIAADLEKITLDILKAATELIEYESQYWRVENMTLVNFINNYNPSYLFG